MLGVAAGRPSACCGSTGHGHAAKHLQSGRSMLPCPSVTIFAQLPPLPNITKCLRKIILSTLACWLCWLGVHRPAADWERTPRSLRCGHDGHGDRGHDGHGDRGGRDCSCCCRCCCGGGGGHHDHGGCGHHDHGGGGQHDRGGRGCGCGCSRDGRPARGHDGRLARSPRPQGGAPGPAQ